MSFESLSLATLFGRHFYRSQSTSPFAFPSFFWKTLSTFFLSVAHLFLQWLKDWLLLFIWVDYTILYQTQFILQGIANVQSKVINWNYFSLIFTVCLLQLSSLGPFFRLHRSTFSCNFETLDIGNKFTPLRAIGLPGPIPTEKFSGSLFYHVCKAVYSPINCPR